MSETLECKLEVLSTADMVNKTLQTAFYALFYHVGLTDDIRASTVGMGRYHIFANMLIQAFADTAYCRYQDT